MNLRFIATCFFVTISFVAGAQIETAADSTKLINDDGKLVFEKVEIEASFAGGEMAWRKFLEKNLNPNVPVDNGAPCGKYTVYVQFVVNKEGNISDVKALTKNGYGMEQEVIRLIKIGPKWTPALQDGRTVNAYRKQPVTFMIDDESFDISSKEEYVLYIGIENPITITADKVKADNLHVTISHGSIVSKGNGNYIVKVNKPGRAVIEIYNAKKGIKEIGSTSFEVKPSTTH